MVYCCFFLIHNLLSFQISQLYHVISPYTEYKIQIYVKDRISCVTKILHCPYANIN